ncbi:LysR family transcriptional regulator [Thiotrichales bacterium 19S3-7]|nr:LysR family transcriptional regulator [Thiotrichales bacterium 19S3-7]MCF6802641.1 LysR family transcriptional regulator [Thiotrichales bacterium 19S3-11]
MSLLSPSLEAFIAIAKYHTVHQAADSLHLTQTAVTQRIRTLEEKLSISLFIRSRKGMQLTEEGKALLRYCQATKMLEKDCMDQIFGTNDKSIIRVKITAPSSIMNSRVIPNTSAILKRFPNLRVTFDTEDSNIRNSLLSKGEVDFAVLHQEQVTREMQKKVLKAETYYLIGSKNLSNQPIEEIVQSNTIIDFDETDQATFSYLKQFNLFNDCQKERYFINNIESLIVLLRAGIGYTVLTHDSLNQIKDDDFKRHLCILNGGKTYQQAIALCWYLRPNMPKYFRAIIDSIN